MSYVIRLEPVTPLARTDSVPWTSAVILEADSAMGPYSSVDEQLLSPRDTDPSQPTARVFTTLGARYANGHYRISFNDTMGGTWTSATIRLDNEPAPTLPRTTASISQAAPLASTTPSSLDWFTLQDLRDRHTNYTKLAAANDTSVNAHIIPGAIRYLLSYVGQNYSADNHALLVEIAKNYVVNRILADDEAIMIARARGQNSITVAGETISLDLTQGRNWWLSPQDEAALNDIRGPDLSDIHTDKMAVRTQGLLYSQALGSLDTDYVKRDEDTNPWYMN